MLIYNLALALGLTDVK